MKLTLIGGESGNIRTAAACRSLDILKRRNDNERATNRRGTAADAAIPQQ